MAKTSCWEFFDCGRQPGGHAVEELGVCSAAEPGKWDGTNGGTCAGRYCWRVAGTFCDGEVQGSSARKLGRCTMCEFFQAVRREEGPDFVA